MTQINGSSDFIIKMPKVELHLHLEGAIPLDTLLHFIKRDGKEDINTVEELRERFIYKDFDNFIRLWCWKNTFIKEEEDFELIVYEVLKGLHRENVKYVEAFYSPVDFKRNGLTTKGITEALIRGKERAYKDMGIKCDLIADLDRDFGPHEGMIILEEVTPYLGKGVIGIGIGGSEGPFPPGPYEYVYREAKKRGFRLTVHGGEAAGAGSIREGLEKLDVERIGHGLRAFEDPSLVLLLKEKQIPLEMCVVSNIKTGVCEAVEKHPIRDYFDNGLMVTVNSDDPVMFNSSITEEYLTLFEKLHFTREEIKRIAFNGIDASFMSDEDKRKMREVFAEEWERLK